MNPFLISHDLIVFRLHWITKKGCDAVNQMAFIQKFYWTDIWLLLHTIMDNP